MITGIRGLCNGLGPALYGFVFYLFHVELTDTDGSEKGAKSNMANPTDEVSMNDKLVHLHAFSSGWNSNASFPSRLLRVPSSQVPPSCLVRAQCCCLCWLPCSSQSTQGPEWGLAPIRSTATGHRVIPTAHKAVVPRARSRCWKTAVYNLSFWGVGGADILAPNPTPPCTHGQMHAFNHMGTFWPQAHVRLQCSEQVFVSTAQKWALLAQQPVFFFFSSRLPTLKSLCQKSVLHSFWAEVERCVRWLSWTLILWFSEVVTEWRIPQLALLLVHNKTQVIGFPAWVACISNVTKSLCDSSYSSVASEVATLSVCPVRAWQTVSGAARLVVFSKLTTVPDVCCCNYSSVKVS